MSAALQDSSALVLFRVGPVFCCTPSQKVMAVITPPAFTQPPGSSEAEPGIFRHNDRLVRGTDLRVRFGVDRGRRQTPGRIIIAEFNDHCTGFWVDEIVSVVGMPLEGWGALPPLLPRGVFSRTLDRDKKIYLYADLQNLDSLKTDGYLREYVHELQKREEFQKLESSRPTKVPRSTDPDRKLDSGTDSKPDSGLDPKLSSKLNTKLGTRIELKQAPPPPTPTSNRGMAEPPPDAQPHTRQEKSKTIEPGPVAHPSPDSPVKKSHSDKLIKSAEERSVGGLKQDLANPTTPARPQVPRSNTEPVKRMPPMALPSRHDDLGRGNTGFSPATDSRPSRPRPHGASENDATPTSQQTASKLENQFNNGATKNPRPPPTPARSTRWRGVPERSAVAVSIIRRCSHR